MLFKNMLNFVEVNWTRPTWKFNIEENYFKKYKSN